MKIGSTVTLTEVEQEICELIAQKRYESNRAEGVKVSLRCDAKGFEQDIEGFGAEMALCRLFNVYPDLEIFTRSSAKGEDNGDCLILGKTVDVKVTKYHTGKLIGLPWKKGSSDLYALMTGVFPTFVFRGFMTGKELYSKPLKDLGRGTAHIAEQGDLREIEEII